MVCARMFDVGCLVYGVDVGAECPPLFPAYAGAGSYGTLVGQAMCVLADW